MLIDEDLMKQFGISNKTIRNGIEVWLRITFMDVTNIFRLIKQYGIFGVLKKIATRIIK